MLRFLGFKASLNILNGTNNSSDQYDNVPTISIKGAYRSNTEEFFNGGSLNVPPKRIDPSMVKLPTSSKPTLRQTKSTSNLTQPNPNPNLTPNLQQSTPNISQDPNGGPSNNNRTSTDIRNLNQKDGKSSQKDAKSKQKEPNVNKKDAKSKQKNANINKKDAKLQASNAKLQEKEEKKRQEEQKKRDKLAAQEQAKQEKLKKEREKQEAQKRAKEAKRIEKENKAKNKKEKKDTPKPKVNPLAQGPTTNPLAQNPSNVQGPSTQYSTNTLESSISKSSGPPPYTTEAAPKPKPEVVRNKSDDTGNTSFSKPVDQGVSSWDMISQHRQQINRQIVASAGKPKQTVMDLQFDKSRSSNESSGA